MISWKDFQHEGKNYPLSHLHPQLVTFTQAAKNGLPERFYEVQVIYSLHCFTRGTKPTDDLSCPLAYADSRETRMFDFHRYDCSKLLPNIVHTLPTAPCFHTGHGNFFTVKVLNPSTGAEETYEVYFTASRSSAKPVRVNLFVESAYVRDRQHDNRPARKKINFFVILYNTLHGKPINPPPQ